MSRRRRGEGDPSDDQRQPEEDQAVAEHRRRDAGRRQSVDDQGPDQPAVDAADAARDRQQPAELADQITHQDDGQRGGEAEGVEGRPEHRVVEGPVAERPRQHAAISRAHDLQPLGGAVDHRATRRAEPAAQARGVRAGRAAGPESGDRNHRAEHERCQRRREGGQPERQLGPDPERHHRSDYGDGEEVDAALDQEEGDRPTRDALAVHASAVQHPGAERQPAGPAGGDQRAHRQLRATDLPASPPAQPGAEDRPEHDHVGREREGLEDHCQSQPAGLRVRQAIADLAQPRGEQEDRNQHAEQGGRLQRAATQSACLKLAGQVWGRRRGRLDVDCGGDVPWLSTD